MVIEEVDRWVRCGTEGVNMDEARRTYWRVTRKMKSLDENRMSAETVIGMLQKGTSRIDHPM